MGSITLTVVGDATVGTRTKTWTVSDADINRLVAFCKATYPVLNANGTISTPTTAQALASWANGFMAGTQANIQRFETSVSVPAVIAAT